MRYRIGMYGGSFNPLHLGHVNCIIQAANMCEKLYIVLSVGYKRDEIDMKVRYRWLYQLTKHIGNVEIFTIEDDADTKEKYTNDYWQKDAEYVKTRIGEKIDIVFCGSDYDKNSFWNICYPESEFYVFERNEISSTKIRNNPYKCWEYLPNIVKPYYVKKVLLIGGESTGKSTLTINLANYYNTNYIEEAGREISEKSGTDTLMLTEDFVEILLQHKLNEMKAIESSNKLLFIDTDALITLFFMEFLEDEGIENNKALADAIDSINKYDLILFFEPDVKFVRDGGRSEVIENNRCFYSEKIKELFREHNKNFVSISGDYQERYIKAINEIDKLICL